MRLVAFVIAFTYVIFIASYTASSVIKEGGKIYIVDRTGERWDITQAVSIGYDPNQIEFGIGRNAFQTLDERHWATKPGNTNTNQGQQKGRHHGKITDNYP